MMPFVVHRVPDWSDDLPNRIALVHEWFSPRSTGGAELVVEAIDGLLADLERSPQLAALVDAESDRPGSWLFGRWRGAVWWQLVGCLMVGGRLSGDW